MKSLAFFILAVAAAALIGGRFRPGEWYAALQKPAWNPPGWIFAPVWTLLYIAIAVAGWLAWRANPRISTALLFWIAQMIVNAMWSWLFFGLHRPDFALLDIAVLLICIVGFAVAAFPVSRVAASLFVPYAIWVGFATALNFYIWQANRLRGTV